MKACSSRRSWCVLVTSSVVLGSVGCSPPSSTSEPLGRTAEPLVVTPAILNLSCPKSSYVLDYNGPLTPPSEWQRICQLSPQPAFVVLDDTRASDGVTSPTDQSAPPGFFHAFAPTIKVLKYIPTNYARTGSSFCPGGLTGTPSA